MTISSEDLFHVKRTLIDCHKDPSGALQTVAVLGTYTSLAAAKRFAKTALFSEGYSREDFDLYAVNSGEESWPHGDGVAVHAVAPSGEVFKVALETKPNAPKLVSREGDDGRVGGDLYHVLQTTVFYDEDRSGARRRAEIEGTYREREEAVKMARVALLDDDISKEWYAKYDERSDEEEREGWEWGEDGVVHAVGPNGENYLVEVVKGK